MKVKGVIGIFYSVVSILLICGMLAEFWLVMPNFFYSLAGRVFMLVWGTMAVALIAANVNAVLTERKRRRLLIRILNFRYAGEKTQPQKSNGQN